ncbi:hypothetical protein P7H16_11225 [Paenibacillus larvae]|nr:hypothetical protein [Paenibacillus larvae]MDT2247383.1 hypothetical protein [Paenibacillus larvae]
MLKAVGQFFYGDNFNELAFVVARGINGFKLDNRTLDGVDFKTTIQSVLRWLANFTPKGKRRLYIHH